MPQPLAQRCYDVADRAVVVCVARSHKLEGPDHPLQTYMKEMEPRSQFHPDAVAAEGTAGSVLLFDCRLMRKCSVQPLPLRLLPKLKESGCTVCTT